MELDTIKEESLSGQQVLSQSNVIQNNSDPDSVNLNFQSNLQRQPASATMLQKNSLLGGAKRTTIIQSDYSDDDMEEEKFSSLNDLAEKQANYQMGRLQYTLNHIRGVGSTVNKSGIMTGGATEEQRRKQFDLLDKRYYAMISQTTSKYIKPTENTFEVTRWPLIRIMTQYISEQKLKDSSFVFPVKLESVIVTLGIRGCKFCAGFGHGDAKCWTAHKIKKQFASNKYMNAILKKAISERKPDGLLMNDRVWPLQQEYSFLCEKYMGSTSGKVTKKAKALYDQLDLHINDARLYFADLKDSRCYVCHGFGHSARNKDVNMFKDSEDEKEARLYEYFHKCKTFAVIDETLKVDNLSKTHWKTFIKIVRKKTKGATVLDTDEVTVINYVVPQVEINTIVKILAHAVVTFVVCIGLNMLWAHAYSQTLSQDNLKLLTDNISDTGFSGKSLLEYYLSFVDAMKQQSYDNVNKMVSLVQKDGAKFKLNADEVTRADEIKVVQTILASMNSNSLVFGFESNAPAQSEAEQRKEKTLSDKYLEQLESLTVTDDVLEAMEDFITGQFQSDPRAGVDQAKAIKAIEQGGDIIKAGVKLYLASNPIATIGIETLTQRILSSTYVPLGQPNQAQSSQASAF